MATRRMSTIEEKIEGWGEQMKSLKERMTATEEKLRGVDEIKRELGGLKELIQQWLEGQNKAQGPTEKDKGPTPNPNPLKATKQDKDRGSLGFSVQRTAERSISEEEAEGTVEGMEHLHLAVAEVSQNSVEGVLPNHTMKVIGPIKEQRVVGLIDSGATHNVISDWGVNRLGVKTDETEGWGEKMGTGKSKKGRGVCRKVALEVQEILIGHREAWHSKSLYFEDKVLIWAGGIVGPVPAEPGPAEPGPPVRQGYARRRGRGQARRKSKGPGEPKGAGESEGGRGLGAHSARWQPKGGGPRVRPARARLRRVYSRRVRQAAWGARWRAHGESRGRRLGSFGGKFELACGGVQLRKAASQRGKAVEPPMGRQPNGGRRWSIHEGKISFLLLTLRTRSNFGREVMMGP